MIPNFNDKIIQCPYCGCSLMFVQEMAQVTETLKDGTPFQIEGHNQKIVLVCKECNAVVREYDPKKIIRTGE